MNLEPKVKVRSELQRDGTVRPTSTTPTTELAWRKLAMVALESARLSKSTRHTSALEAALRVGGVEVEKAMRQLSLVGYSDVEREFGTGTSGPTGLTGLTGAPVLKLVAGGPTGTAGSPRRRPLKS